jgi:2-haloacid dehalogenase
MNEPLKYLYFDMFGTVVDWYSSIKAQLETYLAEKDIDFDAGLLALEWRKLYGPSMCKVKNQEIPWTNLDHLQAGNFQELAERYHLPIPEADLLDIARFWHYLKPWPDALEGLTRLKEKHTLVTMSNGTVELLSDMAKYGNLPFDIVLGSDIPRAYKNDPRYMEVNLDLLGEKARSAAAFVAAHPGDMRCARDIGILAVFVRRPLEYGPDSGYEPDSQIEVDYEVDSLIQLADILDEVGL